MKRLFKDNKAITLITLVITIVVVVLLAMVTISLLVGEDSVVKRATYAKKAQREAQLKEELAIEIMNAQAEDIKDGREFELAHAREVVNNTLKKRHLESDDDTVTYDDEDITFSLKDVYKGVLAESGDYTTLVDTKKELEERIQQLEAQIVALEGKVEGITEVSADKILEGTAEQPNNVYALQDGVGKVITGLMKKQGDITQVLTSGTTSPVWTLKKLNTSTGKLVSDDTPTSTTVKEVNAFAIPEGYYDGNTYVALQTDANNKYYKGEGSSKYKIVLDVYMVARVYGGSSGTNNVDNWVTAHRDVTININGSSATVSFSNSETTNGKNATSQPWKTYIRIQSITVKSVEKLN